jgi:hypothetical protein
MFIPVVLLGPVLCCGREALLALLCCVRRFLLTVAETAGCRQTRVVAVSHVAAVVRLPSDPRGCRQPRGCLHSALSLPSVAPSDGCHPLVPQDQNEEASLVEER